MYKQREMQPRREVALIRTPPRVGDDPVGPVRGAPAYFFHGDGVAHALDADASRVWSELAVRTGAELMVCETALARRSAEPLAPPWKKASLAQFWQAVAGLAPFACEGGGERERAGDARRRRETGSRFARIPPSPPSREGGSCKFLVRVNDTGDERFNREVLEFCLAGAALEVDLAVIFIGAGLGHLRRTPAAAWRQFPDFSLAPLYYFGQGLVDVAAISLTVGELAGLEACAERVFDV